MERDSILKQHQPLVRRLAQRMMTRLPANIMVDDLIQVGMIGLYDAMSRFDPSQDVKFETFASQRIQGAMLDDLREHDLMSRGSRKSQKEISAAICHLEQVLGRKPREGEVAERLGIPLQELQELKSKLQSMQMVFLEDLSTGSGEDEFSILDRHMGDTDSDPMAILKDQRFRQDLIKAIQNLSERDQQIMSMYFEEDMSLKEIAQVLSLTESRICQLLSQITAVLKKRMKNH